VEQLQRGGRWGDADCPAPLFDTTRLHALAAVEYALKY
jgi:aspartate/glutamate racemase